MMKIKNRIDILFLLIIFAAIFIAVKRGNEIPEATIKNGFMTIQENRLDNDYISLNGNWEYYNGRFLLPKDIKFFTNERTYSEPENMPKFKIGTFFLEIEVENREPIYGVVIPPVYGSYELYFNGVKIAENGIINSKNESVSTVFQEKIIPLKINSKNNNFVLYISNNSYLKGGLRDYIKIGKYEKLLENKKQKAVFLYFLESIMFIVLIYNIVLFLYNRKNKEIKYLILYIAVLIILLGVRTEFITLNSFYVYFRVENILKIVAALLLFCLNKKLLNNENGNKNRKEKLILIFLSLLIFIKFENYIYLYMIYFMSDIITGFLVLYTALILNNKNITEMRYSILKYNLYLTTAVFFYSGILKIYGKELFLETVFLTCIAMVEAIILFMNITEKNFETSELCKEMDSNKEELERIAFYKGMILEKEKMKWDNFIKHFKEMTILADFDGNIIECNPATVKILGLLESEIINKKIWDFEFGIISEDEKTLNNYYKIKNIYEELLSDESCYSQENSEEAVIEVFKNKVKRVNFNRFTIPLNTGKMVGIVIREIKIGIEENKIEENEILKFRFDEIFNSIKGERTFADIEIENIVDRKKIIIGNRQKIYEVIKEIIKIEKEYTNFKKIKIKAENISEGIGYIIIGIKIINWLNLDETSGEVLEEVKEDTKYKNIKIKLEIIGGRLNIVKRENIREIGFYIKAKRDIS